ncbi:hypothetical protein AMATHDRAFT_662 [Amanita thiersii Skay4041]|uniref:Ribosome biogenesis protein NSA1 n=1 Tax=Amanita thiersii Skay4041 TaxID=703135 RepID=A0A2A9NV38_9AGAR|nr:hypothetical protein AMATHDRAFT_662 [Amanita thiersii Skay4041]
MARFLLGDELGHIKSLRYTQDKNGDAQETIKTILNSSQIQASVQNLAVTTSDNGSTLLAATFSSGVTSVYLLNDDEIEEYTTWKEHRLKTQQKFVGLSASSSHIFSCTSNGALRMTNLPQKKDDPTSSCITSLPTRLRDWKIIADTTKFAYGGDEVDVSIWDTERAFQPQADAEPSPPSKKRKRGDSLFLAEIWRAKNVPNDTLGLRQPVRITSLAFLDPASSATHLLAGTELGDVRLYDTRAGRRPASEFKGIGRVGGVKVVKEGLNPHEAFVSDNGSNLFSVDLRNGQIAYGYKGESSTYIYELHASIRLVGLSGAVNSIATAPSVLATTALDRFARIHSVYPLPPEPGQQQKQKGQVLEKLFTKSMPTVVVWDQRIPTAPQNEDENEAIWKNMEHVGDESDSESAPVKRKQRK